MKLQLKKIGNSTGVILPKELLARLGLEQGDVLYITEAPDRSISLSPYDPDHRRDWRRGPDPVDRRCYRSR